MKRTFAIILTFVSLLLIAPSAIAQKKSHQDSNKNGKTRKIEVERSTETASGKTTHRMTSETTLISPAHKFIINGRVALDIPDSCYNIYITDIDKEITESDLVACVPVKNKQFYFETELETIKTGRIRAIMPGNKLCSAWIQIYFMPGFTVDMTVHNGYYDIHNESEYKFMTNAWLNQDAMAVLFENLGGPSATNSNDENNVLTVIQNCQIVLSTLQRQLEDLKRMPVNTSREMFQIMKRMDEINAKMQEVIDKYANSITF
ncbi:MAG: hypothetical protein K2K32_03840 [Muribaculaceae bacterium]|nr:hypothetical protein [Muribaculaceae bacterium]